MYEQQPQRGPVTGGSPQLHTGVQRFMNGVYGWMSVGIAVTAAVAWGLSTSPEALMLLFGTPLKWVLFLGPLAMAWFLPARIPRMDSGVAIAMFMVFAGLLGAGLSYIPLIYTAGSIGGILLVTAGMFATMAMIGWVTKKDLSGMGQFLAMALIGVIIAGLINAFFLKSAGMSFGLSAIVALVAAGLTAYHTQTIKQIYLVNGGGQNLAILGALMLYVDFINLFLSLLRLFGSQRD
jgi:uncharacterized protein